MRKKYLVGKVFGEALLSIIADGFPKPRFRVKITPPKQFIPKEGISPKRSHVNKRKPRQKPMRRWMHNIKHQK